MSNDRIKNTKRNIVFSMLYRMINLLFPFAINYIIIKTIGVEYLGLNMLFASILQVLSLTELGFGTALIFSMYEPIAKNDTEKVSALLALYRRIYLIIGTIILCGGLACIPILPNIIKDDVPDDINIYILFIISLTHSVVSYFMFAYRSALLIASQRKDIVDKVNTLIEIALNCSKILILLLTGNYYLFCVLQPAYVIIDNFIVWIVTKKMYPDFKCVGTISKTEKKSIFSRVLGLSINKLCGVLSNSFDSVIISSFLGLTVLGMYNNYFVITNAVIFMICIIPVSATSSIGNSMVCESLEKNHTDFTTFQFGFSMLSGWAAVCLLCLIQPFIEIWVGADLLFDDGTSVVFSVYMYAIVMSAVFMTYREAAGIWAHDRIRPFVEGGLNLILNITLVKWLGVSGVMLSTILTMGIIKTVWGSRYLFNEYFKGYSQVEYLMHMLLYAVVTVIAGAVTYFVCSFINMNGIPELIVKALICIVIPPIIFAACFFKTKEFKRCLALAKSLIKRK
jgi:O-antigen/teichoic acid export membrane protein